MPRKKIAKKVVGRSKKSTVKKSTVVLSQRSQNFKWTESYSSFLLGVVVVIVTVLFVVSLVRQQNQSHIQQTSSLQTGPITPPTTAPSPTQGTTLVENNQTYYIVKPNDSLWSIAVSVYNDGYKWTEIAQANNLANPSTIFTNDKLLLPNAPQPSELGRMMGGTVQQDAITGNSYTVQKDDTLWSIAVRAYADGYSWVKIAQANNLANPGLIFSGNVLTIPR